MQKVQHEREKMESIQKQIALKSKNESDRQKYAADLAKYDNQLYAAKQDLAYANDKLSRTREYLSFISRHGEL